MPQSVSVSVENNFTKGLITEATALNFPENAVTDCLNVNFDPKGIVSRRLGFDYETGYGTRSITRSGLAMSNFVWRNAAGSGDNNFTVQQVGRFLYINRIDPNGAASSTANQYVTAIDLNAFRVTVATVSQLQTSECQYASGYGHLFVTNPFMRPVYITYNPTADTFSAELITLRIRDLEGLDDGMVINNRPATSTGAHTYNLMNQGWAIDRINEFVTAMSSYPANSDVWWLFKDASEAFAPAALANNVTRGNSPAVKGFHILDAFSQDRSAATGGVVSGLSVVTSGVYQPSTCEFFAGRVFYSGVSKQGFNNKIYFSQIVEGTDQFGKCYQTNDPSSENSFDLLATDGGVLSIPAAGQILKIKAIDGALVVFATNGIWVVTGSTGIGFTASDYTIKGISTFSGVSASSFVNAGGVPLWWNNEGIYTIQANSTTGQFSVVSITDTTIKTFFKAIPTANKKFARGTFDDLEKTVTWVYRSTEATTFTESYEFDSVLVLNSLTGAFYVHRTDTSTVKIHGIISYDNPSATVKYVVSNANLFTLAEEKDTAYKDWATALVDGVDYSSYFVSGFRVRGDAQKKFQSNYIWVFSRTVDSGPSSYFIQAVWDYATSPNEGRWSNRQRMIHTNELKSHLYKKIKLRGHGLSCQFRITSLSGVPFDLVGWSVKETTNNDA